MLRVYFLQQWFNLSDPAVEEALHGSASMRGFVGIDLGREAAPDETTVCDFRHLLEHHKLGQQQLATLNERLKRSGIKISNSTIVDATIISAPSSTKNRAKARVRAKVEHSIGVVKHVFGFQKVRYRGLAKNLHRPEASAAPANLFMARRQLLRLQG